MKNWFLCFVLTSLFSTFAQESSPLSSFSSPKKFKFTAEEDKLILDHVEKYGAKDWKMLAAEKFPTREARAIRERYRDYLNPKLNLQPWTDEDSEKLWDLYKQYGQSSKLIAQSFPGRSRTNIKNHIEFLKRHVVHNEPSRLKKISNNPQPVVDEAADLKQPVSDVSIKTESALTQHLDNLEIEAGASDHPVQLIELNFDQIFDQTLNKPFDEMSFDFLEQ